MKFDFTKDQLTDLLDGIFSGDISEQELPEDLYYALADTLKAALYEGFGGTLADYADAEGGEVADLELLEELRDNVYMFSAAKTYTQVREMVDCMYDSSDGIRSFDEFEEMATSVFEKYNLDKAGNGYLRTEYDTAISSATSAVAWNRFEREKDALPMLEYSTIGDACDICAPLDGLTAPVDDPIWDTVAVPNHFNCRCLLMQQDESAEATANREDIVNDVSEKMDDEFKMNPGKDGYIFKEDHPYFEVAEKDEAFAKNNFGLPIPETDDDE